MARESRCTLDGRKIASQSVYLVELQTSIAIETYRVPSWFISAGKVVWKTDDSVNFVVLASTVLALDYPAGWIVASLFQFY